MRAKEGFEMVKGPLDEKEFEKLKRQLRDIEQSDIAELLEGINYLIKFDKSLGGSQDE